MRRLFGAAVLILLAAALGAVVGRRLHRAPAPPRPPVGTTGTESAAGSPHGRKPAGDVVLSFVGDCAFGAVNGSGGGIRFPALYRRAGRLDYPFARLNPWFANDDLTVANFECTLTEAARTADKQWHFKGPASYAAIFPAASVEAVALSNNHAHDYLDAGFRDTVAAFRQQGVSVFYQNAPLVTTLKGVETVILGDCSVVGENTTVTAGVAERVLAEIDRYKKPGNIVVVMMHWGSELDTTPTKWQQETGRRFIDAGADAVVGGHPHVLQGIERYRGRTIAYSLGNFAFGGNSLARFPETVVLRLRFPGGKAGRAQVSIVPCRVSSTEERDARGVLRNNYQPQPLSGEAAGRVAALVLRRSAGLTYGVKKIALAGPR